MSHFLNDLKTYLSLLKNQVPKFVFIINELNA